MIEKTAVLAAETTLFNSVLSGNLLRKSGGCRFFYSKALLPLRGDNCSISFSVFIKYIFCNKYLQKFFSALYFCINPERIFKKLKTEN